MRMPPTEATVLSRVGGRTTVAVEKAAAAAAQCVSVSTLALKWPCPFECAAACRVRGSPARAGRRAIGQALTLVQAA